MKSDEALIVSLFLIGLIGFALMATAYMRLFAQAWKAPDRRAMMRRVLFVQPRKNADWPNMSREADWIAIGALFCFVTCVGLPVCALVLPACVPPR